MRFEILADARRMLEVFQRELPRIAREPVRITHCKARLIRSQAALRESLIRIVYTVRMVVQGHEHKLVLLGAAPESAGFLDAAPCRALHGHDALAPFTEPALHLTELSLALRMYPLDPNLPALAEIEGGGAVELLGRHLVGDGANGRSECFERELRHYKPFKRAVLRVRASSNGDGPSRALFVKLFADERGALLYRHQRALFEATRNAHALRIPEPLAYDPERRMLLMAEVPGPAALIEWIDSLEKHGTLPPGVRLARVQACLAVVAEALAELQSSGIRPRARLGYGRQLACMAKDRRLLRGPLSKTYPDLTRRVEQLVARLEELTPEVEELVPAHGGFRHKQMIGDEHCLTVIDWDGLCSADPALDAASFLLRLRQGPLGKPGCAPEMAALADGFRREFLARVPRAAPARLALYEGLTLTEGILRSFRHAAKDGVAEAKLRNMASAAWAALDRA